MPKKKPNEEATENDVYVGAQRLLAARDHSVRELRQKLLKKKYPKGHIETVLEYFIDRGWLDDERFAELQTDSLVRQLWGPLKILEKLTKHGVDRQTAQAAIDALDVSWSEKAEQKALKKYGEDFRDQTDTAYRYLTQRGFPASVVRRLLFDS